MAGAFLNNAHNVDNIDESDDEANLRRRNVGMVQGRLCGAEGAD